MFFEVWHKFCHKDFRKKLLTHCALGALVQRLSHNFQFRVLVLHCGFHIFVSHRLRWGLIPYWAKDISIVAKTINAVSETAAEKPAFREALRRRRCLIPADAFYEWKATGQKQKQPYSIGMVDDSLFAFAGLWDRWGGPFPGAYYIVHYPDHQG